MESLQVANAIRRCRGWPWRSPEEPGLGPLLVSILIRVSAGGGLAAAAGASNQISTVFAAFALGVTAPLVVEKLTQGLAPTQLPDLRLDQLTPPTAGAAGQQARGQTDRVGVDDAP